MVALDGPGSSGKSSVGAAAALRVGYRFCDTGLLYRAVTWLALARDVRAVDTGRACARSPTRSSWRADAAGRLARVLVDGVDRTADVHTPPVDAAVSADLGRARAPGRAARAAARARRGRAGS